MPLSLNHPEFFPNNRIQSHWNINRPLIHAKLHALSQGGFAANSNYFANTFWPYWTSYQWPHPDNFANMDDNQCTLMYIGFPFLTPSQKEYYRNQWLEILAVERQLQDARYSTALNNQRINVQTFDLYRWEVYAYPRFNYDNEYAMAYLIPFWTEYGPSERERLRSSFKEREKIICDYRPYDPSSGQIAMQYCLQLQGQYFPWNEKTCSIYFKGFSDFSPSQKEEYIARRNRINYLYGNLGYMTIQTLWNTQGALVQYEQNALAQFELDNSPWARRVHDAKCAYVTALEQKQVDDFTRNLKQSIGSFLSEVQGQLPFGITAEQLATGIIAGTIAAAAIATGGLALEFATPAAAAVGVSEGTATTVLGAAGTIATKQTGSIVGGDGLGVGDVVSAGTSVAGTQGIPVTAGDAVKKLPSLGVDTNLPGTGEEKVGLFDGLSSLGNDTFNSIKNISISGLGSTLVDSAKNLDPAGLLSTASDAAGNLTAGDVVAIGASLVPQTAQASAAKPAAPSAVISIPPAVKAAAKAAAVPTGIILAGIAVWYFFGRK